MLAARAIVDIPKGIRFMLIIQRRDGISGLWVDALVRHSTWSAHLTARRTCRRTGHDYRVVAAHSRDVLETALASELGQCCSLEAQCRQRQDYGLLP